MEYWVVYQLADGAELYRGSAQEAGMAARQELAEGLGIYVVPREAVLTPTINMDVLKSHAKQRIDTEAERVRERFITSAPGQTMEYQRAREQAIAYQNNPEGVYTALQADALAGTIDPRTGTAVTSIAQAADLIIFSYELYGKVGDAIRIARLVAKSQIAAATNIKELAAVNVDWEFVVNEALS